MIVFVLLLLCILSPSSHAHIADDLPSWSSSAASARGDMPEPRNVRIAQGSSTQNDGSPYINPEPPATARKKAHSAAPEGSKWDEVDGVPRYLTYKTPYEYHLTVMTVALGLIFIFLFYWSNRNRSDSAEYAKYYILLTVIFSAMFLIVAGYTEKQTAPVFGLLGTIVGYMFGVFSTRREPPNDSASQPPGKLTDGGTPKT